MAMLVAALSLADSRPARALDEPPLPLSLSGAIARGLEKNLGILLAEQSVRGAGGARWQALSALLPNVALRTFKTRQKINLAAFGFPLPLGQSPLIGPFNVVDLRVAASAPLFDYSAIERARASGEMESAAGHTFKDARDLVVFVCANLYLQAVNGASRIDAARAQLRTAQALADRAVNLKQAGVVAGIEVLRAQVQLEAQQQRVIVYEHEFAKQKLALERAIGLPLDQSIDLTDSVPYAPLPEARLEDRLAQAYDSREDYKGAQAMLRAAEAAKRAATGEAFPTVRLNTDYGRIGNTFADALGTYSVNATVTVPLFQGGRVHGRMLQADAQFRQQAAQVEDLRSRIEYDVRTATLDGESADQRVRVAKRAAELAAEQLAQAQDRFAAGVTGNLEVVQAQEAVATATDNYLTSLHAHNVAKISLARAIGLSEERVGELLGGRK